MQVVLTRRRTRPNPSCQGGKRAEAELRAVFILLAGKPLLLLKASRGGGCGVTSSWLVSRAKLVLIGRIREHHSALGTPSASRPLAGVYIILMISRGLRAYRPRCGVLL
jgi:hypothetical protein